jgi:hypothetical protein
MEEQNLSNNFTLYLILIICSMFVALDTLELYKFSENWNLSLKTFNTQMFDKCIKYQMLAKACFSVFSLFAALSSFVITFFMIISVDYFINKLLNAYVYINTLIFGPYMLGMTILGLFNWDKILFICDNTNKEELHDRFLSFTNLFNIIACFILSFILTLGVTIYKSLELYINSILRKDDGNYIIRKLFWWAVYKNRNPNTQQ